MSLRARRRAPRRAFALAGALVLVAGALVGGYLVTRDDDGRASQEAGGEAALDPCSIPPEVLQRVRRGYYPGRSGDVLAVERLPNQFNTRHSGPHPYTQEVPLVLYGPGFIKSGAEFGRGATVADIAPTFAELLGFDEFNADERREGNVLEEALLPPEQRNGRPRLLITLVWDGGGDNVLEQWPRSWPNLKRLMGKSVSYPNATVGSSPSITPSVHATIGTGAFPREHGLPDTRIRVDGKMIDAWEGKSPENLEITTLADDYDLAMGNAPKVGLAARDSWHLGMIGHGSYLEGADRDVAVLDSLGSVSYTSNEEYFTLPEYATSLDGLEEAIADVDQRDGEADGMWLGNPLNPQDGRIRETPAWSIFQTEQLEELLTNEQFGQDEIPDLFFTNYKSTDLVGHSYNMVEPEERDALEEQDRQLPVLIDFLDEFVGSDNYVLALTADHGMTPYPSVTGGWSIVMRDMETDIAKKFDTETPKKPLVLSNRGYQIFLNPRELERNGVTAGDIAAFLRDYRLNENLYRIDEVPKEFADRAQQKLFSSAFTPQEMKTMSCGTASS